MVFQEYSNRLTWPISLKMQLHAFHESSRTARRNKSDKNELE